MRFPVRDLYLPIAFIEATGRATIGRYQLELSINILVAILTEHSGHPPPCPLHDPLESKLKYLVSVPRSNLLKHEWWRKLGSIAVKADALNEEYASGAFGALYSRGGGYLEELMLPLAKQARAVPTVRGITPARMNAVGEEFRELAQQATELAALLLKASERP